MSWKLNNILNLATNKKATILFLSVVFFFGIGANEVSSQKRFSKTYPASKNIRIQLTNRTGTITVLGWAKKQVKISAWLERPVAKIVPRNLSGTILINVVRDNRGRRDVGSTNFTIRVPYAATVDIETVVGDLVVSNIQGGLLRAHITSEGDIRLTNIGAKNVSAKNVIGDIFYDGLIQPGGIYRFISTKGNINLRIPFRSSFRLVATAPSTRKISLGSFRGNGMNYLSNGRRVVGKIGNGSASLTITNKFGSISFIRR